MIDEDVDERPRSRETQKFPVRPLNFMLANGLLIQRGLSCMTFLASLVGYISE